MRQIWTLVFALCVATLGMAQKPFPVSALPEEWVEGNAPKAWEPGHFYIIECWATWCGPCRQAMPHMEKLNQAVKGEPIHIIGVSIDTNVDKSGIRKFLKGLSVAPTYTMGIDPNGTRIKPYQAIFGIPFAMVVCDGEIIQTAHPMNLEANNLIERARASVNARKEAKAKALLEKMSALQSEADAAAQKKDWAQAAKSEREALQVMAEGTDEDLAKTWRPAGRGHMTDYFPASLPEAKTSTEAGDAAPYAQILGKPLPADDAFTIVSLIALPREDLTPSYETFALIPGVREGHCFPEKQRRIFVAPQEQQAAMEAFLKALPFEAPQVTYAPMETLEPLFDAEGLEAPPYFAVFRSGECLWKGSHTEVPRTLRKAAKSLEAQKAALAKEQSSRKAFLRDLERAEARSAEHVWARLFEKAPSDETRALTIAPFFALLREQDKVAQATQRLRQAVAKYKKDSATLLALEQMLSEWPELAQEVARERSDLLKALAEQDLRLRPTQASAHYWMAAAYADSAKASSGDALRQSALDATISSQRYQRFLKRQPTLPAR